MKVLALVSGGKDSCFSAMLCGRQGHEIVALGNLAPDPTLHNDDLDSWMFQTVGHSVVERYSECTGLPLFRVYTRGESSSKDLSYTPSNKDEVEDLFQLVRYVQKEIPTLQAVCSGAIASDYQRLRVESVCSRLNLISLSPLWRRSQKELLDEMIANGIHALLVKVAALGLDPERHLGQNLTTMQPYLSTLRDRFGCNICGEGGEYETLVVDCPLFRRARIVIDASETHKDAESGDIAPSGILSIQSFRLESKDEDDIDDSNTPSLVIVPAGDQTLAIKSPSTSIPCWGSHVKAESAATDCFMQIVADCSPPLDDIYAMERCLVAMLEQSGKILGEKDMSFNDVVFVQLILRDMSSFTAVNEVYRRFFPLVDPPSRACVQLDITTPCRINILALRRSKAIEIHRRVLHVQSISSWAPCCIGPYSQATSIGEMTFVAGQLGLRPESMDFSELDWEAELKLALHHCQAIAVAVGSDFRRAALRIVVYFSDPFFLTLSTAQRNRLKEIVESELLSDDDAILDSYLKPADIGCTIKPIISCISVPALPKSARIEIQPILLNGWQRIGRDSSSSDKRTMKALSAEYQKTDEWSSAWLQTTIRRFVSAPSTEVLMPSPTAVMLITDLGISVAQLTIPGLNQPHTKSATIQSSCQFLKHFITCCHIPAESLISITIWYKMDAVTPNDAMEIANALSIGQEDTQSIRISYACFPVRRLGHDLSTLDQMMLIDVSTLRGYT